MCRLLGYVAAEPASLRDVLGEAGLDEFTALSDQHKDGWGIAWWAADDTLVVEKSPEPARQSDRYRELAATRLSDAAIVHLRWATPTLAVTAVNNHPFVADRMAFAHNGRILPVSTVEELVAPELRSELTGTTDSERFFFVVRSRLAEGGTDLVGALGAAARDLSAATGASSLNCLLLSDTELIALSCYDEGLRPLPAEPEHFRLQWSRLPHAVVVGSTGWSQPDWQPVPNGSALVVDRATRHTRLVPVADPPVLAAAVSDQRSSIRP